MTQPRFRAQEPPPEGTEMAVMVARDGVTISGSCRHGVMTDTVAESITAEDLLLSLKRIGEHHGCAIGAVVYVSKADEVRFVRGRIRFYNRAGRAPFPSAVVVWRPGGVRP
jgi:hypothetical protein